MLTGLAGMQPAIGERDKEPLLLSRFLNTLYIFTNKQGIYLAFWTLSDGNFEAAYWGLEGSRVKRCRKSHFPFSKLPLKTTLFLGNISKAWFLPLLCLQPKFPKIGWKPNRVLEQDSFQ